MPLTANPPPDRNLGSGLVPALGLFTTTMMVVGGVIGSGIFRKPGVMASQLGSAELLVGVWVLAGIITLFGALTNAEIAAMIPETGGQYVFFHRIYGPFAGFLYGWAIFAVAQSGSIAALAYIFAESANHFFHLPELPASVAAWSFHVPFVGDISPLNEIGIKALAAALIILLSTINYFGVKFGAVVQNIFAISKIGVILALILAAVLLPSGGSLHHLASTNPSIRPSGTGLVLAIAFALQGAFWAYDGWNSITYVAGEVKQPQRNLPRGITFGMLIVTALYVLMNVAYCYVLPIDAIAKSKLVAADVAEKCFSGGGKWVALGVMISTFGATNAITLTAARVYFSMGQRNVFPQFVGRAHPRFHTPAASLLIQGIWSSLLLFSGTFDNLTDTLIFVSWIFYAAGAYGIFILRRREHDTPRPYRVPGFPVVPWIFVLFAVLYLLFTIYNDITGYRDALAHGKPALINSAFGTALVLLGTPIYFFCRRKRISI